MKIDQFLVNKNSSIKEAMRVIDCGGRGIAFVVDKNNILFGVITDGDIRRAIIKGANIEKKVEEISNRNPLIMKENFTDNDLNNLKNSDELKKKTLLGFFHIPVVNEKRVVKDMITICIDSKRNLKLDKMAVNKKAIVKVLVAGGAGYLGSVLCDKLLKRGYKVRVLDNLTYGNAGIKELLRNKNFEFSKGDVRNISDLVGAAKDIDAVIHLAAIVGDPACARDPKETLEINYLATKNIVETCKYFQINRFIFASTCSVYGKTPSSSEELIENSPLNPVSLYSETKIKCEQAILGAMDENFSPTILRMATLYGYSPNMRFDLVVNLLTAKAIFEKKISIFGGNQWRPWLHLEDAAEAYVKCLKQPLEKIRGEVFNVLSENYKIIDVGRIIKSFFPEAKLELSKKIIDKRDYNVSFAKISKFLNYQPRKKITDGVSEIKNIITKGQIKNYKDAKYRL